MTSRLPKLWLVAFIFGLLALMPKQALAGMTPEEVMKFEKFKAKAEQGDANAQNSLGSCYNFGEGVAQDTIQAVKWYSKAAEILDAKAFQECKVKAQKGDADAQFYLGLCYTDGRCVTKDDIQAVKWYRKAAEQGDADAQFRLGMSYNNAEGVLMDLVQAALWFRKAAEQPVVSRKYFVENFVHDPIWSHSDQSLLLELSWYKALEQGTVKAQYELGYYYDEGLGVVRDSAQAFFWYRKAAEQGNPDGLFSLAVIYAKGQGVVKDETEAYAYYSLAGITREDARKALAILEKILSPEARLRGQQRSKELQKEIEAKIEAKQAGK